MIGVYRFLISLLCHQLLGLQEKFFHLERHIYFWLWLRLRNYFHRYQCLQHFLFDSDSLLSQFLHFLCIPVNKLRNLVLVMFVEFANIIHDKLRLLTTNVFIPRFLVD